MLEPATASVREAVNALAMQVHSLHVGWRPDIYVMPQELYSQERMEAELQEKALYVARQNGIVVGYALLEIRNAEVPGLVKRRILIIDELCVSEDLRGQGVGRSMMEEIHTLAKELGCTDLQLSVQPENEAALALYRKCGFTVRSLNLQRKVYP